MPHYVLAFRAARARGPDPEQEAAWDTWLGEIRRFIVDPGHRVAGSRQLGGSAATGGTLLGGYLVIEAKDMNTAVVIAVGCPGLRYGGAVDVGEVIE